MKNTIVLGGKTVSSIIVTGRGSEVLAIITPSEIIEKDGCKVVLSDQTKRM